MSIPILSTKLYIPQPRPNAVFRPRLIERLDDGRQRKLSLISASAGSGKTTLVSEWLAHCDRPAAWLSLDEGDNGLARFLTYLVASLQTLGTTIGEGVFGMLQSPNLPPAEAILTVLINEIASIPAPFIQVLDDYHVISAKPVHDALLYLFEYLPPNMHLVIATREDPHLPLAKLRVRNQLTELRAADLKFTHSEAAGFLNHAMGLNLSSEQIALLEARTEGWIAGLQLAAISMQGQQDTSSFIESFNGNHSFVLDYLVEEALQLQSPSIQAFLLRTSILDRMCGSLCDAVAPMDLEPLSSGQEILEYLGRANLFIVPLDNERRWFRYHHLFADLLRQRLQLQLQQSIFRSKNSENSVEAELHIRASEWYEDNGLEIEAFQHAVAANDVERAARIMEGNGMPLYFRGAVAPMLKWLESLPAGDLHARPSLSVAYASVLLFDGQIIGVEEKLQAAEAVLQDIGPAPNIRDLIGHIASIRATLAVSQHEADIILTQSRRALEYLHPDNVPIRTATTWTLGYAYHLKGDRTAAIQAYSKAIDTSQTIGHHIITLMASIGLGNIQEADNQLHLATQTYREVLQRAGDSPLPLVCEAHLGLARILYEWNDLDAAEHHGQHSIRLARLLEHTDRFVAGEEFLARLTLARGDAAGAAANIARSSHFAIQHNFVHRIPEVVATEVLTLLRQGNLTAAAQLAQAHDLPLIQARVHLAHGDTSTALAMLGIIREQMEAKDWKNERLKVMVLQAVTLCAHGDMDKAVQLLGDALTMAEPGGFIRIFVDEGDRMSMLLTEASAHGKMPDYIGKLLAVLESEKPRTEGESPLLSVLPLIEPLSGRELEILQLIAQGLSNSEICERLYIALDTVKGHNRRIYGKLQVQRRTEAVARARELGLLT
ncbi:LuxR C-terminal-related transcriptional regulator [Cohnella mopanensis]|uniref:LuxR C-terminal-related transcriptional regulator n=1 Tax=Cohnella mopanensis TaxID=2911966 RepID=UPI001EF9721F|nr:LuxR C-terminal-related transcriptional regulator [Cohnella mopanensis]